MMEKNKKNAGFTLVEVLVAITIMALTGGILLSSFTVAIKLNARAEREYEACQQAQVVMEKLLCDEIPLKDHVETVINSMNPEGKQELINGAKKSIVLSEDLLNEEEVEDDNLEESDKLPVISDIAKKPEFEKVYEKNVSAIISECQSSDTSINQVLCTITVTIKDGETEIYQLNGKRIIYF